MNGLWPLVILSLQAPRMAAQQLMGWRLPGQAAWLALLAAVALNAVVNLLPVIGRPVDLNEMPAEIAALIQFFQAPLLVFAFWAGFLVVFIYVLTWACGIFGGQGSTNEMALLWAWLQGLRALGQVVMLVLSFVAPPFVAVVGVLFTGLGLWITSNFVAEAQGFDSAWQAFGILVLVFVGLTFALVFGLTFLGVIAAVGAPNV